MGGGLCWSRFGPFARALGPNSVYVAHEGPALFHSCFDSLVDGIVDFCSLSRADGWLLWKLVCMTVASIAILF